MSKLVCNQTICNRLASWIQIPRLLGRVWCWITGHKWTWKYQLYFPTQRRIGEDLSYLLERECKRCGRQI